MLSRFPQLALQEGPRPGIVHRLDKDTSGLVIVALSETGQAAAHRRFAQRRVHKTYLAVTRGVPPAEGTSDLPIGRHPTIKTRMAVVPEEKGGRCAPHQVEQRFTRRLPAVLRCLPCACSPDARIRYACILLRRAFRCGATPCTAPMIRLRPPRGSFFTPGSWSLRIR